MRIFLNDDAHEVDAATLAAALESLGYTATEARRAAGAVAGTDGALDARIKAALQELARSR